MINIHTHLFLEEDIPRGFLPLGLVRILSSKVGYFLFARILKNLNPFSNKDQFDRYCQFVKMGKGRSQTALLNELATNYPPDTKFCVMPMDMAYMGAGKVPRPYEQQLAELSSLSQKNKNVLPFVHIDTRRNEYMDIFHFAMAYGFKGVKLYPPLGQFPFDANYNPIYAICEKNSIPILAHCTSGNPVHFKGSRKELKELLKQSELPVDYSLSNKELCSLFTHPSNYKYVFDKFPQLKVCLAHFGRENDWDNIILDMLPKYDGLYIDISYSLYDESHWASLLVRLRTNKHFRERCLFGSDWYMNIVEGSEKQFSIKLRAYLGEELWEQIAETNCKIFLNI